MDEQEQQDLQKQVQNGRAAQITLNFLENYLLQKRAAVINDLEKGDNYMYESLMAQKVFLCVLRDFENMLKAYVQLGEIAEKELNENG